MGKLIFESLDHFKRGQDPLNVLKLGISHYMGFSSDFKGIEFNDGNRNMYISEAFGEQIFKEKGNARIGWEILIGDFYGRYGRGSGAQIYRCDFLFKRIKFGGGKTAFYVGGRSGTYGFNYHQTKRETLGKRARKNLYDQLWNHLLTKLPSNVS